MVYFKVVDAVRSQLQAQGGFKGDHIPLKMGRDGSLTPYRGLNVLALNLAAKAHALQSSVWGAAGTWRDGAKKRIRKGEKACAHIVWVGLESFKAKKGEKGEAQSTPEDEEMRKVYKTWPSFCASQIEGLEIESVPRGHTVTVTHEEAHKVFLEVVRRRLADPPPSQKVLDPVVTTIAIQLAHAFLDMACGRSAEVNSPELWGGNMLPIIGVASECFDALEIPPEQMYAYGVPVLPKIPDTEPEIEPLSEVQSPAVSEPEAAAENPAKPRKRSRAATPEEVARFLDW